MLYFFWEEKSPAVQFSKHECLWHFFPGRVRNTCSIIRLNEEEERCQGIRMAQCSVLFKTISTYYSHGFCELNKWKNSFLGETVLVSWVTVFGWLGGFFWWELWHLFNCFCFFFPLVCPGVLFCLNSNFELLFKICGELV